MSLIEEAIPARLAAVTAVTDLVASRVYPLRAPQGVPRPFVVVQRISAFREIAFGSNPGLARPRFQVTAWGETYASAKAVATAVRQALERFRGTVVGVEILDCFVENDQDLSDDEANLRGVATDVFVHHREA